MTDHEYHIPRGIATVSIEVRLPTGGSFIAEIPNLQIEEPIDLKITEDEQDFLVDDVKVYGQSYFLLSLSLDGKLLAQSPGDPLFSLSRYGPEASPPAHE